MMTRKAGLLDVPNLMEISMYIHRICTGLEVCLRGVIVRVHEDAKSFSLGSRFSLVIFSSVDVAHLLEAS